ncbi:MAG: hypothetical protein ACYCX4_12955 [Bacillota bacterium]
MPFKYANGTYKREWNLDLTGYELLIDLPGNDITVTIYTKAVGSNHKPYFTYAAVELIASHTETIILDDFGQLTQYLTGIVPLINAFPAEPAIQPEPIPVSETEQPEPIIAPEKPRGFIQKIFRR